MNDQNNNSNRKSTGFGTNTAAVHECNGQYNVLVASFEEQRLKLHASESFSGASDQVARDITHFLDQHDVGQVLQVLPSAKVICRTYSLATDLPEEEIYRTLSMNAETHLLGMAPDYRMGQGILPITPQSTNTTGMVIVWPEANEVVVPDTDRPVLFTAEVVALAALVGTDSPSDPLLFTDQKTKSIAVGLPHTGGIGFRSAQEHADDTSQWIQSIKRLLTESAIGYGHTDQYMRQIADSSQQTLEETFSQLNQSSALLLPESVSGSLPSRFQGLEQQTDGSLQPWLNQFGIAAGALLAKFSELAPMTVLQDKPIVSEPNTIERFTNYFSQPRHAFKLVAGIILCLAIGIPLLSYVKLSVLKMKYGDTTQKLKDLKEDRQKIAMYEQMQKDTWPMTKILSDISCNTPPGIDLDVINLTAGQRFKVSGIAKRRNGVSGNELATLMKKQLEATKMFNKVKIRAEYDSPLAKTYNITLDGIISEPYKDIRYTEERDFAKWTMQQRVNDEPSPSALAQKEKEKQAQEQERQEERDRLAAADTENETNI